MNGGSDGKTVVSMEDVNDEMWDRLFALPDMDPDRSPEWSEGPSLSALVGGPGFKRQRTDTGDSDNVGDSCSIV